VEFLGREAISKKKSKDIHGAKNKMIERKRILSQLQKLQNSIYTIDLHKNTIEGSVLDRTVIETLRASGDALKQIGASSAGLRAVEDLVMDVEQQMESAAEITKILSSGSVTGMVNTMAIDGTVLDEEELMKELEEMMMDDDDYTAMAKKQPAIVAADDSLWPSVPPVTAHQHQKRAPAAAANDEMTPQAVMSGGVSFRKVMHADQE
jgi:hypothetical protein